MKISMSGYIGVDLLPEPGEKHDLQFKVKHKVFGEPCVLHVGALSFKVQDGMHHPYVILVGTYESSKHRTVTTTKQYKYSRLPKRIRDAIYDQYRLVEGTPETWKGR